MYPFLPESSADLVPWPQIDGPKLKPFNFHGPQNIQFLGLWRSDVFSHVLIVRIREEVYILKLFRFADEEEFYAPQPLVDDDVKALEEIAAYNEPFNAECRAFGRLEESGHAELAVECFGYVLLDDEHERDMMHQCGTYNLDFNGTSRRDGWELRSHYLGKDGKLPPIRGIVKKFGLEREKWDETLFGTKLDTKFALKIRRDIIQLQQLGIFHINVNFQHYINGKIADFSTAFTTPHLLTHPELTSPSLPPTLIAAMEYETFVHSITDYWSFDDMVKNWNFDCERGEPHSTKSPKDRISVLIFPNGRGVEKRYFLRRTPQRERMSTFVDPRSYDWKASSADAVDKCQSSGKASSSSSSRKKPGQGVSKIRKQLPKIPPRWYYDCKPYVVENIKRRKAGRHYP